MNSSAAWPALRYEEWRETCDTVHAHTQVLGKLAVASASPAPRSSSVTASRRSPPRALPAGVTLRDAVGFAPQALPKQRWLLDFVRAGAIQEPQVAMGLRADGTPMGLFEGIEKIYQQTPAWEDVPWIRERWDGPLVVKGILTVEDARRAVDEGADAIVISNHGGNVLDGSVPTLPVLPEIAEAVGDVIEVLVDSGVRRGTDGAALERRRSCWGAPTSTRCSPRASPACVRCSSSSGSRSTRRSPFSASSRSTSSTRHSSSCRRAGPPCACARAETYQGRSACSGCRCKRQTAYPIASSCSRLDRDSNPHQLRTGAELAYERRDARTKVHAVDTRLKTRTIHLTPCETLSDRRLGVGKHVV